MPLSPLIPFGSTFVNQPANPTAPASTSAYKMQGLGATFTPQVSGNALALFSATINDNATTVGIGINLIPYCGAVQSGTAVPANAGNIPGNAVKIGNTVTWETGVTLTTAADSFIPITVIGFAPGLTIGQQYWFDLAAESITTASAAALTNLTVIVVEVV